MSIMSLFDLGRSGIHANQTALSVTSNNIANVNTPGYSRQSVIMQTASPIEVRGNTLGRGVGDININRQFDNFIYYQIIGQSSSHGESYAGERSLSYIEQVFNEAQGFGLSSSMEEYFNAWQDVATNPEGAAQRSSLLVKAQAFVNTVKQMESDVKATLKFMNDEIGDVVKQINVLTTNIATINGKIMDQEAGGTETANVFRDQREQSMKELAELTDFGWYEDADGSVTIVAGRGSIVAGVNSYALSTAINIEGDREIYNGSGTDITSFFNEGQLGGYISTRSDIRANPLYDLRKMTASIINQTNMIHYAGYGLDSTTTNDFFNNLTVYTRDDTTGGSSGNVTATIPIATRANVTLDEYDVVFSDATNFELRNHATGAVVVPSGTYTHTAPGPTTFTYNGVQITISGTTAANDTFFVSPLEQVIENFTVSVTDFNKVAASSAATTLPGDNSNALSLVSRYESNITNLSSVSYNDHYAEIVTTVGSLAQSANDSLAFEENLLFELNNRRDSVSGVSLDEEAANLIRYQRAYQASARIIKITDELLELVINL